SSLTVGDAGTAGAATSMTCLASAILRLPRERDPVGRPASLPAVAHRHVDRRAAAPSRQDAILVLAHLRQLGGKPHACQHQEDAHHEGQRIDRHAVAIVIVILALAFEPAKIADRRGCHLRGRRAIVVAGPRMPGTPRDDTVAVGLLGGHTGSVPARRMAPLQDPGCSKSRGAFRPAWRKIAPAIRSSGSGGATDGSKCRLMPTGTRPSARGP